jgi:putative photosynthetic complex assembly protein
MTISASATPMRPPSRRPGPKAPRLVLLVLGTMVAFSMLMVAIGSFQKPTPSFAPSRPLVVRSLHFVDTPEHGVAIVNAADQRVLDVLAPGSGNFVRATLRGLAQQRMRSGVSADVAFRLTAWEDGRLTLEDPATSRVVELEAFGPTNREDFARMLTLPGGTP